MKKSFIVIGLGRFGSSVARTLSKMNCDVIAIDVCEETVGNISNAVSHCAIADSTKIDVLRELGAASVDHAVVSIGNNLQASILTVVNLNTLGIKNITVRVDVSDHKKVFNLLGATDVILPEEASGISLANQIVSDSILDYYHVADNFVIVQISVSKDFEPKNLVDLDVRNRFDINIVGIIKDDQFYIPRATDSIYPEDTIVVVGKKNNVRKFDAFLN